MLQPLENGHESRDAFGLEERNGKLGVGAVRCACGSGRVDNLPRQAKCEPPKSQEQDSAQMKVRYNRKWDAGNERRTYRDTGARSAATDAHAL